VGASSAARAVAGFGLWAIHGPNHSESSFAASKSLLPFGPTKTRPRRLDWAQRLRWSRSSGTSSEQEF